jgi:CheY-like chemotaxis protein
VRRSKGSTVDPVGGFCMLWSRGGWMKSCKVLLVHDDEDLRSALADLLVGEGYPVEVVSNGHEALEKMKADYRPDVIISDLLMPLVDGYELNRELKRHASWSSIPLIVLTGLNIREPSLKDIEALLQIPMDVDQLLNRLGAACEKSAKAAS